MRPLRSGLRRRGGFRIAGADDQSRGRHLRGPDVRRMLLEMVERRGRDLPSAARVCKRGARPNPPTACETSFLPSSSSDRRPRCHRRSCRPSQPKQLGASLAASRAHARHTWRDTPPVNPDGTVNGYIEIPRGERRKFEFDMRHNRRAIDRVMPASIGGYPVNYGFVPQTISYDGDPFDILVLGPAATGGTIVSGTDRRSDAHGR